MLLSVLKRRIARNKARFAFTLVSLMILSMVLNYVSLRLSANLEVAEKFVYSNINVEARVISNNTHFHEDLSNYGEIYLFLNYNRTYIVYNNQKYRVLLGKGYIKMLNITTPNEGVIVIDIPEIRVGDYILINGKREQVVGSYYLLGNLPIVLYRNASGDNIYIMMRAENVDALKEYLFASSKVLSLTVYDGKWYPYKDEFTNLILFFQVVLYITVASILILVVGSVLVNIRSLHNEILTLKYIGIPLYALMLTVYGEYILSAFLGYLAGIPLGVYIAYKKCVEEHMPLSAINVNNLIPVNTITISIIILASLLPSIHLSSMNPVQLRVRIKRRSIDTSIVLLSLLVGFSLGVPVSTIILAHNAAYMVNSPPFQYIVYGPVDQLDLPGDYGVLLTGQKAVGASENVTIAVYVFPVNSSLAPLLVKEGRWIKASDEAVISRGLSLKMGVKIGDAIRVEFLGYERVFKVVGVSELLMAHNNKYIIVSGGDYTALAKPNVLFTNTTLSPSVVSKLRDIGCTVFSSKEYAERVRESTLLYALGSYSLVFMLLLAGVSVLTNIISSEMNAQLKVLAELLAIGIPDKYFITYFMKIVAVFITGFLLSLPPSTLLAQKLVLLIVPVPVNNAVVLETLKHLTAVTALLMVLSILTIKKRIRAIKIPAELRW